MFDEDLLMGFSQPKNLSVSEVNAKVRNALEPQFDDLIVEGEISNFTRAGSGHLYFTLKDSKSQIRCVMWRNTANYLRFTPEPGMQVVIKGGITVYQPRGEYQLNCRTMEPAGAGALQLAFEQLKEKLTAEGLFDADRKQALPYLPQKIGVVTSPSGAAIRDFLSVIERRYPNIQITIFPALVQGNEAPPQIVTGIETLDGLNLDVLVVTRGGGSMEDLWAFNDEKVARAIAAATTPVISAVGHEIDFTIADFVADLRVPTPSAAAEIVVGRKADIEETISSLQTRITRNLSSRIANTKAVLKANSNTRLAVALQSKFQIESQRLDSFRFRATRGLESKLTGYKHNLAHLAASLDALSPLQSLARGYGIATLANEKEPLNSVKSLKAGDKLTITLADGEIGTTVDSISARGKADE